MRQRPRGHGSGYVSGAGAYNKGVSDADARVNTGSANYQGGYNAGITATKKGTAAASQVLSGTTFTNASGVNIAGAMPNKSNTMVDARAVTQDGTYTYVYPSAAGYYDTNSHIRAANVNLANVYYLGTGTSFDVKSRFPNDWQKFTVDNFIIGALSMPWVRGQSVRYADSHPAGRAAGFTLYKNYENGIFRILGAEEKVGLIEWYTDSEWPNWEDYNNPYGWSDAAGQGYRYATCVAYLIIGTIR